jgi:hypothetical protein
MARQPRVLGPPGAAGIALAGSPLPEKGIYHPSRWLPATVPMSVTASAAGRSTAVEVALKMAFRKFLTDHPTVAAALEGAAAPELQARRRAA